MERAKQLPYKEPPFCTYQRYACFGVVAMQNPDSHNWYLSRAIGLSVTRHYLHYFSTPELATTDVEIEHIPFLDCLHVDRHVIKGLEFPIIRNMIDEGYYVYYSGVDPFYIEGALWSGESHKFHDGMICGYDDNDHTFTVAIYDKRWIFRCFKTSQDGFMKALESGKERGGYDNFVGVKPRYDPISLDLTVMADRLEAYLIPDPHRYDFDYPDPVHGIAVHDYLRLYMQYAKEGEFRQELVDRRILRLLWEHKRCMADRIVTVESLLGAPSTISTQYASVVERADRIRTLYSGYHLKPRNDLLTVIMDELSRIKASEEKLLPQFLELVKEAQNAVELPKAKNE